ncbi:hypothetical protein KL921_003630 [Ogataea angusta]|uniref:Lariat debranching enzyme C-terminal domain-containing protein n=1 Tax=Pichia angusta TaxID=870730 RepID=A0ABQ7RWM7_PICAN|nr:hypothetical protein KL921_003630 [Ogataea angusta]KAG7823452.1 hypothetical protein KL909_002849 [Ogataea angusta]KAG7833162.1 hypothetical protein KL943_004027 [Ogataea angusta]KAG7839383.1 hypothetical protein KL942_003745 [Ogataea angusta]KAG7849507.1 hypothetical protein KL940_002537 [Ogataea angusta]
MLTVAVEGCCHGQLNAIYRSLPKPVDLLIICGDFQSIRNRADLECLAVPQKYRQMGDFQDYYTGRRIAPVMTIFVGGNHEASNYLSELRYGGFVAPNIYYLGRYGVIWYKGLRIAGISGIYNETNFLKPRKETLPYDRSTIRSVYHYRNTEVTALKLLQPSNETIMVSHDWPEGIYEYGRKDQLLRCKPFFKSDMEKHQLGSPPLMALLRHLRPSHWFSAHMHVKFEATVSWKPSQENEKINKEEIELELNDASEETADLPTRFLALDKCLPRRKFMEVFRLAQLDVPTKLAGLDFFYDPEYISILRTVELYRKDIESAGLDLPEELITTLHRECDRQRILLEDLETNKYRELLQINSQFSVTADASAKEVQEYTNPQTVQFIEKFLAQP